MVKFKCLNNHEFEVNHHYARFRRHVMVCPECGKRAYREKKDVKSLMKDLYKDLTGTEIEQIN